MKGKAMGLLSRILRNGADGRLTWWCPGCDHAHTVRVGEGPRPRWGWNGDAERPTFTPSVLVSWGSYANPSWRPEPDDGPDVSGRCHSFVVDGAMQFLGDCTHALAGQTVPIPPWPRPLWRDAGDPEITMAPHTLPAASPANHQEPHRMSKSITLALALTGAKADLPAGKTFAGFRFQITTPGADPTETVTTDTTVTFSEAAPGVYTASVVPVDQNGDPLEAAVVVEVTVPEDAPPPQFPSVAGATLTATVA